MDLVSMDLSKFAETLASDSPAPGGGSVAALCGALAAALAAMVGRLTVGRDKYKENWPSMEAVRDESYELRAQLLKLVDKDTQAYNAVFAAYKLPKDSQEEKDQRQRAIQQANKEAALVPMQTARSAMSCLNLVRTVLEKGNPNCITDAGVAAELIRTAARGAAYNVLINLGGIKDQEFVSKLKHEVDLCTGRVDREVDEMTAAVMARL